MTTIIAPTATATAPRRALQIARRMHYRHPTGLYAYWYCAKQQRVVLRVTRSRMAEFAATPFGAAFARQCVDVLDHGRGWWEVTERDLTALIEPGLRNLRVRRAALSTWLRAWNQHWQPAPVVQTARPEQLVVAQWHGRAVIKAVQPLPVTPPSVQPPCSPDRLAALAARWSPR